MVKAPWSFIGCLSGMLLLSPGEAQVISWGHDCYGLEGLPPDPTSLIALSAGDIACLGLRAEGTVVAWGNNSMGQTDVPAELTGAVAIAAGSDHSLALTATGTLVAWGDNEYGQASVPPGLGDVVAISCGFSHSLALRADGTVVAWGANYGDQTNVPVGLTNVAAVAAGSICSLALLADGAPVVTSALVDRTAGLGLPAHFAVTAVGAGPLHYQWRHDGFELAGESRPALVLPQVRPDQAGWYAVEVRNAHGVTTSRAALLSTAPLLITSQPESQT